MSPQKTLATARRVLSQLQHDPRTVAMVLFVPIILITLLKYVFAEEPQVFNRLAPVILGIFPLVMMFLITSIATLRERKSGTLDRLMTMPISKFDLIFGYALAFSAVGFAQACLASTITLGLLGITVMGGTFALLITAIFAAFLGTTLGLFVSAFAKNEFQAVQLVMPAIMPQILLCGLFVTREHMSAPLQWLSSILPLTYSVDAMQQVAQHAGWSGTLTRDLLVIIGFGVAALVLGAHTIQRQE